MTTGGDGLSPADYAGVLAQAAQRASRALAQAPGGVRNEWLARCARRLRNDQAQVLAANARDVEQAPGFGLTSAAIDRLTLNPRRLGDIAGALEEIIRLPDPVGEVIDGAVRPNGLQVRRVRVPLGVVFFIYESRPNVTVDAGALCVKSGNAVILRGGKEALHSNRALHQILSEELAAVGLPAEAVQLVGTLDRAVVGELLQRSREITVTIPRGGKGLIERVTAEARMPVIKHFDGVCHVYVDAGADLGLAGPIVVNAKCQRPAVCNAAECLLVHEAVAAQWLPGFGRELQQQGVELRGCPRTCGLVPGARLATDADYATEYGELKLSVKVVSSLDEALAHIERFGSHHTDAIVTQDVTAARRFLAEVDSAAVMLNASTRFNDGGELGLGAEIGISTDRFHARGPCGLRELMTYKYVVEGTGQVRG